MNKKFLPILASWGVLYFGGSVVMGALRPENIILGLSMILTGVSLMVLANEVGEANPEFRLFPEES